MIAYPDIPRNLYDSSMVEAFWHTHDLLERCIDNRVTLRLQLLHVKHHIYRILT